MEQDLKFEGQIKEVSVKQPKKDEGASVAKVVIEFDSAVPERDFSGLLGLLRQYVRVGFEPTGTTTKEV